MAFSAMATSEASCVKMRLVVLGFLILCRNTWVTSDEDNYSYYDAYAPTRCEYYPAAPLYNGGILVNPGFEDGIHGWNDLIGNGSLKIESQNNGNKYVVTSNRRMGYDSPAQRLQNLTQDMKYALSAWVQIRGPVTSAFVKAILAMDDATYICAGNVIAKNGCWSFLKGGFVPEWSPSFARLHFESNNRDIEILVDSVSLQPFTEEEWRSHQEDGMRMKRMRKVILHVTDMDGNRLDASNVTITQKTRLFPFGSAIANTILGNTPYQNWFVKRFNTAVFENELKWYTTEPQPGKLNYSFADQMLAFCNSYGITVRGHNIFWEDPKYVPSWVTKLGKEELQKAVRRRIQSLVSRYSASFINWDVSNEMLHFTFYEDKLGPGASDAFFQAAQKIDSWTPMFMNDYNVVETCEDPQATADAYIEKLRKIIQSGRVMEGIGLESHFSRPNLPFMRAVLDKLSTLGLPIWLTEVDVNKTFGSQTQARYLEQILREAFAHPAVEGIMMWSALHPYGCYQMCLTDKNFTNLPTGDVVDRLLEDWTTTTQGLTDENGAFKFHGFHGDYEFSATYGKKNVTQTTSVCQGDGVQHVFIQIY